MRYIVLIPVFAFLFSSLSAQNSQVNSTIDNLLTQGNYERVIDTCKQILASDSLNPELFYKIGLAYQNLQETDSSISNFRRAYSLNPENRLYTFILAKGYYNKGKYAAAEPLFSKLCSTDSTRWIYAFYLTSIYVESGKFDKAINIYEKFLSKDSTNCIYLDRLGYTNLKKGNFDNAITIYNKSLSIDHKNIPAIKNLAYLYANTMETDTASQLLTRGIDIDSTDMDLYLSRANIYYSKKQTKDALNDYLKILASGDTSKLLLKRIGICYCNNLLPAESVPFLIKAYKLDTLDFEVCSYLGQSYSRINDYHNSIKYYKKEIDILLPVKTQLGYAYNLYAESQKEAGLFKEAIASYIQSLQFNNNPDNYMRIANLYDNELKDKAKAIYYYQKYLNNISKQKPALSTKYVESIKKRLEYLKMKQSK